MFLNEVASLITVFSLFQIHLEDNYTKIDFTRKIMKQKFSLSFSVRILFEKKNNRKTCSKIRALDMLLVEGTET